MIENGYASRGTPVTTNAVRVLDAIALRALMGDAIDEERSVSGGHVAELGSDASRSPIEIITYPECVDGHVVIHTGHKDSTSGMSVEDGSIVTVIPCAVAAEAPESQPTAELAGMGSLASVPPDLVDRLDPTDSVFVVVTAAPPDVGSAAQPVTTTWDTASCENGHVVMHYGHEDPNTMTSVYDGAVVTSVPC